MQDYSRYRAACRPLVVKTFTPALDKGGDFDLDHVSMHTLQHYECVCPDEFFYACTPGRD